MIAECAGRPVEEIDGPLLDVLELGAYQLLRTRIAPHAAVATSVDLVRAEAGPGKAGFVNAVLRRVSEKTEDEWVAAWPRTPSPTRWGTWHSATRTPSGSRRRSPTRSAPTPPSCRTCWSPTTLGPESIWSRGR